MAKNAASHLVGTLDQVMKSPDGVIVDARVKYKDVNRFIMGSAVGNMKLMLLKVQLRMAGWMAMKSVTEVFK